MVFYSPFPLYVWARVSCECSRQVILPHFLLPPDVQWSAVFGVETIIISDKAELVLIQNLEVIFECWTYWNRSAKSDVPWQSMCEGSFTCFTAKDCALINFILFKCNSFLTCVTNNVTNSSRIYNSFLPG